MRISGIIPKEDARHKASVMRARPGVSFFVAGPERTSEGGESKRSRGVDAVATGNTTVVGADVERAAQ